MTRRAKPIASERSSRRRLRMEPAKDLAAVSVPKLVWVPMVVALAALAWFAFAPVLENGFVDIDDYANIRDDHNFRGLGWKQVVAAFTTPRIGVYQPLGSLLLSAEYVACGLDPRGYHATSLVVHALNAVVLFGLVLTVLGRWNPIALRAHPRTFTIAAGLAVAWFAAHPARAEPVAWVTAQLYLPCALFEMLALLAYLRAHPPGGAARSSLWLAGSCALALIAMLFMPGAVCLPFLFLIFDVALLDRLNFRADSAGWVRRAAGLVAEKLPILGLAIAMMPVAYWAKRSSQVVKHLDYDGPWARLAQAGYGVWLYLGKMVAPFGLSVFYPRPEGGDFRAPVYAAAVIGVVIVSAAIVALRKRVRWLPVVWVSYLLVLAPHLGLIRVGQTIASDRYTYFASIFWVVPLAGGLAWLGRLRRPSRLATVAAGLALVVGIASLARTQARTWHDSESLWLQALKCAPGSSYIHAHYATALGEGGKHAEALTEFDKALAVWPNDPETLLKRGTSLAGLGRLDEAIVGYRAVIALRPDEPLAYLNLGASLAARADYDEAVAMYRKVLDIQPGSAEAYINLGAALLRQSKLDEAVTALREAVGLEPWSAEANTSLGAALAMQGKLEDAIAQYNAGLSEAPDHVPALINLGIALAQSGLPGEALAPLEKAVRLEPGHAEVHHALGAILASLGRLNEAVAEFTEALRLNPAHLQAGHLLAACRRQLGEELLETRYR
jgi:protein O-mannosyl-transferase